MLLFFFKQKTAYEMRMSDWSSDVCSSDLLDRIAAAAILVRGGLHDLQRQGRVEQRPERQRQLVLDHQPDHAERRTAQRVRVLRAGRLLVDGETRKRVV